MNIQDLKEIAHNDRLRDDNEFRNELGFAEDVVDGKHIVVTARKIGSNKGDRKIHSRFTVTELV